MRVCVLAICVAVLAVSLRGRKKTQARFNRRASMR